MPCVLNTGFLEHLFEQSHRYSSVILDALPISFYKLTFDQEQRLEASDFCPLSDSSLKTFPIFFLLAFEAESLENVR